MEIKNNISSFLKKTVTKCVFKPKQNGQKYVKKKNTYVLPCAPRWKQQTFYTAWCAEAKIFHRVMTLIRCPIITCTPNAAQNLLTVSADQMWKAKI